MLRWFVGDLRTGRQLIDIPVLDGNWARPLNNAETVTAVLDMQDPYTIGLHPRTSMTPGRTYLACAEDDIVLGAGPIWTHGYRRAARTLELRALGGWSYFDHRLVMPLAAATLGVQQFIIPDPSAAGKTKPNPTAQTYLSALEWGTIAKRWVQQAQAWTGGSIPVVFETDRVGAQSRNIEGTDFKNLGTVLKEITKIEGGPDIRFRPRFTADRLGIEWVLETGTDAAPLLGWSTRTTPHQWDLTVPGSAVSDFDVDVDASQLAGIGWAVGGRSSDTVLVSRITDTTLTDMGFPLFEDLDSSHSTAGTQSLLDGYAASNVAFGRMPFETWPITVEAHQQPFLGSYWEGDFCTINAAPYDPDTGTGDPYLYEGAKDVLRRIVSLTGDAQSTTVKIVTQAAS